MSALTDMVVRWDGPAGPVVARPIATIGDRGRMVLRDTADLHYLATAQPDGRLLIAMGPTSVDAALDVAALVLGGGGDHHSVTALINLLALALIGTRARVEEARPCTTC